MYLRKRGGRVRVGGREGEREGGGDREKRENESAR